MKGQMKGRGKEWRKEESKVQREGEREETGGFPQPICDIICSPPLIPTFGIQDSYWASEHGNHSLLCPGGGKKTAL